MSTPSNEPHNPYSQGGPSYDGGSFNQPPQFHGHTPSSSGSHSESGAEFQGRKLAQDAMVLGILGVFVSFLGFIFGPLAITKAHRAEREFHTVAAVGRITGCVATVMGLLWLLALGVIIIARLTYQ